VADDRLSNWVGEGSASKGGPAQIPFLTAMVQDAVFKALTGSVPPSLQHPCDPKRAGEKRRRIIIQNDGEIDINSPGKNLWDSTVRTWVPKLLDMSIVKFEKQNPKAVAKLRKIIDREMDYEGELDSEVFTSIIKKYMKLERGRLKLQFQLGKKVCPPHIEELQWERLVEYWTSTSSMEKAARMATARSQVKDFSNMGRKGRASKLQKVCVIYFL
jgi:ribosomal protein L31E